MILDAAKDHVHLFFLPKNTSHFTQALDDVPFARYIAFDYKVQRTYLHIVLLGFIDFFLIASIMVIIQFQAPFFKDPSEIHYRSLSGE